MEKKALGHVIGVWVQSDAVDPVDSADGTQKLAQVLRVPIPEGMHDKAAEEVVVHSTFVGGERIQLDREKRKVMVS